MAVPKHAVTFQYLAPGAEQPTAGHEMTDGGFDLPYGATVPRVGEFFQHVQLDKNETYEVLAVTTRVLAFGESEPGWVSVVTLGPILDPMKQILSIVRE